jgi:hypothetical protein
VRPVDRFAGLGARFSPSIADAPVTLLTLKLGDDARRRWTAKLRVEVDGQPA